MTFPVRASADDPRSSVRDSFADAPLQPRLVSRRPAFGSSLFGRRRVRRRGIILLMSLSLLTLFLMMLVTLIVITGQYRQSARVQARRDRVGDPPHKIVDLAMKNILVGSGANASSTDGHEILRDLYGGSWRGVIGVVPKVHASAANSGVFLGLPAAEPLRLNPGSTTSFLTFEFRRPAASGGYLNLYNETTAGDYTGCILTFVGGPVRRNVSVRILEYVPPASSAAPDCFVGRFTVARSNPEDIDALSDAATLSSSILTDGQVTFVVNERALSGYGAGYWPSSGAIQPANDPDYPIDESMGYNIAAQGNQDFVYQGTQGTSPIPMALVPHYRSYDDANLTLVGYGGLNEDYDAVDYQNMFLASVPPGAQRADQIVPSFWRPELINYWRHYMFNHDVATDPTGAGTPDISMWYQEGPTAGSRIANDLNTAIARNNFYRRIILRPLPTDHPEFSGSNADWALPLAADHTDRANMSKRLWQPLSLLTGVNDNDENGVPDETGAASQFWPPMPDTAPTALPLVDPLSDVNANGIVDQWDVDNDGDGLTDSVWIDIGLPVQRMEDGKLYKPLVAYLIRDLDGLANVNAHLNPDSFDGIPAALSGPLAGNFGGTPRRPRGIGYGPTEIGFPSVGFTNVGFGTAMFDGPRTESLLAARYYDGRPGLSGVNDLLSRLRSPSLPPFVINTMAVSEWTTPPDAWGTQAIGLDYLGQPWNERVASVAVLPTLTPATPDPRPQLRTHLTTAATPVAHPNGPTEGSDDPYEIDLYSTHAGAADSTLSYQTPDTPYTLSELERILRWNDADASYLPNRLAAAVNPAFNDLARRRAVTTHSSHIPAAPSAVPSERRISDATVAGTAPLLGSPRKWSLYHLYAEKLIANADSTTGATFDGTNHTSPTWDPLNVNHRGWVDNEVRKMMPWESWHGMKMDLNRRWQNGFDDDGDGTVDEPDEVNFPETVFPNIGSYGLAPFAGYNQPFDHLGADPQLAGASNRVARQIYARHLYCLALFVGDYDPTGTSGFGPQGMFDNADYDPDLTPPQMDELFKRRLAQWAMNAVDYRDPDAICSPFEYDVNPFDGWSPTIDGDPATSDPYPPSPNPPTLPHQRRIVWGVEAPHLLITENSAFHDRRVVDSTHDTSGQSRQTGDTDLDQHRVPQGSLFVELFAVGNRDDRTASVPAELYDRTDGQLVLSKETPGGNPVWRVAISAPHDVADTTQRLKSAFFRSEELRNPAGQRFAPTSFDPNDLNLLTLGNPNTAPGSADAVTLERFITFGPTAPPMTALPGNPSTLDNTFYYRSGATKVDPGEYAVIAPRALTYMTLMDDDNESTAPTYVDTGTPPLQTARFQVTGNNFFAYDNFHNGAATYIHPDVNGIAKIRQPKAFICAADQPMGWPQPIGANISEPLRTAYYPDIPTADPTSIGFNDGYAPGNGSANTLIDQPFDGRAGMPLVTLGLETKTTKNWRTLYLQRLANPLENYHEFANPYITVDFSPVDIAVYNGDDSRPASWTAMMQTMYGNWDSQDPQSARATNADPFAFAGLDFMSRERGEGRNRTVDDHANFNPPVDPVNDGHFNLWRHRFVVPTSTQATAAAAPGLSPQTQFRHNLLHTLGYLNVSMGMDSDPALTDYTAHTNTDYLGAPPAVNGTLVYSFPWLNWADRPFATPLELLAIPHSSQTTWFEDWQRDQIAAATPVDPYRANGGVPIADYRGYYGHLFNFFHRPANRRVPNVTAESPQLARLFDYVETPSPFAGSMEFFDTGIAAAGSMNRAPGFLRAGNSELSRFRDPGRVNLNTMPPVLWGNDQADATTGVTGATGALNYAHPYQTPSGGFFGPTTTAPSEFAVTRRGFDSSRPTWHYPTRIAKPYRSAGKADLAPLLPGADPERLRQFDVDATLLRSDEFSAAPANPRQPLFAGPRHVNNAADQHQHTDKNPYFRYEQLTRLPNLTSTQSNVYAVWATVGYFEAHKTSPETRNPALVGVYAGQSLPDGVWLGQEIGADTGRNRRHRGFYIIDRSMPAAFEPGNDHNVEKTILVRRYLD